jgi:uncharacterized membrane protein YeaQ/YmgE (transglycosylase-associated protein family)
MEFIWMLIIGLIAGAIAKLIMPGRDPGGIIITMLLGVAGAFLGGFLFRALGIGGGGFAGLIGAVVGALILLALYRLFTRRRGAPRV